MSQVGFGAHGANMGWTRLAMISDWELWACAQQQVAQHGGDAAVQAAMHADALLADGDLAGQRTWLAVLNRINQLTVVGADQVRH